jgi:hypothetical protein
MLRKRSELFCFLSPSASLRPEKYVGKTVLDWEAGFGGFAGACYLMGARQVFAIDRVPASGVARHWPDGFGQAELISRPELQAG